MGRVSLYHQKIEPRLEEIKAWRATRMTKADIAHRLGVGSDTLSRNMRLYPELKEVMTLPLMTPEEIKEKEDKQRRNYTRDIASALSFIKHRVSSQLEMKRVYSAILDAHQRLKLEENLSEEAESEVKEELIQFISDVLSDVKLTDSDIEKLKAIIER
ncbi:MAG: hypothetical protein FWE43_02955 [Streptococcaceae bacterium]|nr:hypothetical protein [Streptococcaceae bacterium]MCL2681422.1 hypothetical protein [Streptococcaceae bacterium]